MTGSAVVRETLKDFCLEFIRHPYLCRTEHSQHAWFFTTLHNRLPEEGRFVMWEGKKVCVVQKEYPTGGSLGKSRRQGWDVALLRRPVEVIQDATYAYDSFRIDSAIEFGMNEGREHLEDDVARLSSPDSHVEHKFIVHLYRLSKETGGRKISGRDWSPSSARILEPEDVARVIRDRDIEAYYAMWDNSETWDTGAWQITGQTVKRL